MSEVAEEIDNEELETENLEIVEEPELSEDETRAVGNGWTDREAWEESGGDPDNWVSAKKFNERGEMIGKIRSLERRLDGQEKDFGERLEGNKRLHEAQMKVTITDLEAKRDDAIDLADRDKANGFQAQIDEVKSQSVDDVSRETNDILNQWNADNTWIFDNTPKASYAQSRFKAYGQMGQSEEESIASMEADIAREFPKTNSRRENAPAVEGGRSKPGSKVSVKLAWSQLTTDELRWYKELPNAWKSKDDYLKAVADERKR